MRHRVRAGKLTPLPAQVPGEARRPAHLVVLETSRNKAETCGERRVGFTGQPHKRLNELRLRRPAESLRRSLNFQVAHETEGWCEIRPQWFITDRCVYSRRPPASRAADRRASSVLNEREFRSAVFPSWLPPTSLCDSLHQRQEVGNNVRGFR